MKIEKKNKILVVPSDLMGVGSFRSIWPAQSLEKYHKDEVEVEINHQPNVDNIEYLKQFDIIHFHRHLGPYENSSTLFPLLRSLGITLMMDIDDYWEPPTTHPLYELIIKDGLSEKITNNLKLVDYVTTTTEVFASYIRKYNKNVQVIPNALNMNHKMWTSTAEKSVGDKCRITWIGGSSHMHDLELMRDGFNQLWRNNDLQDKFQIIMCGFDTRGTITEYTPNGESKTRSILPHETIWRKFEEVFSGTFKERDRDPEYYKWLDKVVKPDSRDYKDAQYEKNYVRRWTLPLTRYAEHYDYCDVCLAPITSTFTEVKKHFKPDGSFTEQNIIRRHIFNEVKSELKIIEAGMKRKVLIAQDFGIYSEIIQDGKNGLLVKNDSKDWYRHMKRVITDKDYREELANNLHEYVKDRYDIKNVTANRLDFYKSIVNSKIELKEEVLS